MPDSQKEEDLSESKPESEVGSDQEIKIPDFTEDSVFGVWEERWRADLYKDIKRESNPGPGGFGCWLEGGRLWWGDGWHNGFPGIGHFQMDRYQEITGDLGQAFGTQA